ncbi:hypothetical protein FSP39_005961 [Pinctada imbricata]|uniref:Uncharacterized protein n=1 Tax=Pinctada imbricata TaxID=66713 RepID=A0AA89CBX1_PINIB|nr:hypothetical protein FSP39_005961 [Pinctada imbricata]
MEEQEKAMNSDKVSSTASEGRKSSKPIMEKRRRARINASLAELKSLLLEVMKSEGTRQNKMEKADILEMTVRHLRQLQHQQISALASTDPAVINKYRLGFNECANEVSKFLGNMNGIDAEIRARLLNHLANYTVKPDPETPDVSSSMRDTPSTLPSTSLCKDETTRVLNNPQSSSVINQGMVYGKNNNLQPLSIVTQTATPSSTVQEVEKQLPVIPNFSSPQKMATSSLCSFPSVPEASAQPLQIAKVFGGFQAIPTKMASGEMAFLIPAANMMSCNSIPNYVIPVIQPQSSVSIANQTGQNMQNISPLQISYPVNSIVTPVVSQSAITSAGVTGNGNNATRAQTILPQSLLSVSYTSGRELQTTTLDSTTVTSSAFSSLKDVSQHALPNNRNRDSERNAASASGIASSTSRSSPSEISPVSGSDPSTDPMWRPW